MKKITAEYKDKITACEERISVLRRRIHLMGTVRLILFLGVFGVIYVMRDSSVPALVGIIAAFVVPFAVLMVYHTKLSNRKTYFETLSRLCANELRAIDYDFGAFDGMADKMDGEHLFSLDLDLFGERSLVQSMNRTVTFMGRERLAEWLQHPLVGKQAIVERQQAVAELSQLTELRQHFYVTGMEKECGKDDHKKLGKITDSTPTFFTNSAFWRVMVYLLPISWVIILSGIFLDFLPVDIVSIWIVVSIVIAYSKARSTIALHNSVNKLELLLGVYSELLGVIEGAEFKSTLLKENHDKLRVGRSASSAIKALSKSIGGLDQRFSAAGIILQILTLRDVRLSMQIERWMIENKERLGEWFGVLADFDALLSMGGFAYNHPDYIYPNISDEYFKMEGTAVGHPLLNRSVCVKNDISINNNPSFLIVTGANMAGKSTYLRTVGVNYVIACCGMPVCADSLTVSPAQLVTSLRTSDNLMSNESYFFAELKRLKRIIDMLQNEEPLFIILDEILKGTNSVDKQKGSLALMKQFVSLQTCGIIATHDLVLGSLEAEFPDRIRNYRFEADIRNDELSFSYRLREGVAQNMNACFLMKKMGITV